MQAGEVVRQQSFGIEALGVGGTASREFRQHPTQVGSRINTQQLAGAHGAVDHRGASTGSRVTDEQVIFQRQGLELVGFERIGDAPAQVHRALEVQDVRPMLEGPGYICAPSLCTMPCHSYGKKSCRMDPPREGENSRTSVLSCGA